MKDEQEKSGSKQGKGTLIAEFSIENVQVVQRRFALQKDRASVRLIFLSQPLRTCLPTFCFRQQKRDPLERRSLSARKRKTPLLRNIACRLAVRRPLL